MTAYYNEFDPHAAAWLRELIADGLIAPGDVDERSIEDVKPNELVGYTQCHFFAGIGGWSLALRLAGMPDDYPIWTGSCPCQPFSAAGKGDGFADERHLWPSFQWLIQERRPAIVAGEQVASKPTEPWIDLVQADLEALGYAFGCVALPAAGVGAPHIRDRCYWLADTESGRHQQRDMGNQAEAQRQALGRGEESGQGGRRHDPANGSCADGGLGHANNPGLEGHRDRHQAALGHREGPVRPVAEAGESVRVANPSGDRRNETRRSIGAPRDDGPIGNDGDAPGQSAAGPTNGFWFGADWLYCRDGKWRPVEPGTFPLVDGLPRGLVPSSYQGMAIDAKRSAEGRVMRLRGYGNAIVPEQAALFLRAALA